MTSITLQGLSHCRLSTHNRFGNSTQPAPEPPEKDTDNPQPVPSGPLSETPPASDAGATPSVVLHEVPIPKRFKGLRGMLSYGFQIMLNTFHIGAAVFVLAGASFIHGPIWVALASIIGVQLLQDWLGKRYKEKIVFTDKAKMAAVADNITHTYLTGVEVGQKALAKIPLIRRLEPLYTRVMRWFGEKILNKGLRFLTETLVYNSVALSQMPPTFTGKLWYVARMVLWRTIFLFTGPFGKAGEHLQNVLVKLFSLQDAREWAKALVPSTKTDKLPKQPHLTPNTGTSA